MTTNQTVVLEESSEEVDESPEDAWVVSGAFVVVAASVVVGASVESLPESSPDRMIYPEQVGRPTRHTAILQPL